MEFFVTGASAVQVGTANFAEPVASIRLLDALPGALAEAGVTRLADLVGTLGLPTRPACGPSSDPPAALAVGGGSRADDR
jgi:hypothetical protein